jgi:hypothetical protein
MNAELATFLDSVETGNPPADSHFDRPSFKSTAHGPLRLNLILKFTSEPIDSSDKTSGSTTELCTKTLF